ncbi:DNA repair ATPase [Nonomuraea sp. NPDC050663]|uniref:DNA repair ATPase n=1 Tax=Nonomuraea sp. NPDC050663 TaxID=3364370 RepID=UPI0037A6D125
MTETTGLEAGTYEVLRNRLLAQSNELAQAAESLNTQRLEVFGGSELTLIGTERLRTENNCVPRDIVSLGDVMLFGYNVFIGLKSETSVNDVFSVHRFTREGSAFRFEAAELASLNDPVFGKDFAELYRYYKETRLTQLRRVEGKLLAVFQTGPSDTRVLRWSVDTAGVPTYEDARGERDHVMPPSHDFEWIPTTRDDHILGRHPHIAIGNEVFVETVGGDLTIKIEDNTESGEGIYTEPVNEPLQSLADADVEYARIGPLLLLRIKPYKETVWRHLVFNTRTKSVTRLDGIGQACQRLPEDQGLIFPGGYYLSTGISKTFDTDVTDLEFERVIRSPNGEDALYVFHARGDGRSLLLPYNVIRKEVANPIPCHGFSLFDDGTMIVFRATSDEPTRVHPMQVWQTPYVSDTYAAAQPTGAGPLERIGNAELVRGISDALSVSRMADEMAASEAMFEALIAACTRAADHYHWLGEHGLREPLAEVRATAEQVLDEFEKVEQLTAQAERALREASDETVTLVRQARGDTPGSADAWVASLASLRRAQGRLVGLREVRYIDATRLDELAAELASELKSVGERAVSFLRGADAFTGYHAAVEQLAAEAGAITTVSQSAPVVEKLAVQSEGLEVVTEVVGSLDIADATVRTSILARIAEVIAGVNRARAILDGRRRELMTVEGRAAFAAEFALLGQAVTGALAMSETPERCDEQLGKLMLQLETLESRFGELDDFSAQLADKRDDVYEAFSARKQTLLDERTRRTDRLFTSASRILASVSRRVSTLGSLDDVNTYFATDPMITKLRSVSSELRELGDSVRAEELDGRIKAAQQEAGRALRDRLDLFTDGGETLRLGRHRFAVNTQPIDLTLVPHDGAMHFSITGTDYRSPAPATFADTRPFWDQLLVSETPAVYRGEHLAAALLATARPDDDLPALVRQAAESRYDEGYERGVHDHDAALILDALVRLTSGAGLLRFPSRARAAAQLYWAYGVDEVSRKTIAVRASSLARARGLFGGSGGVEALSGELGGAIARFLAGVGSDHTRSDRTRSDQGAPFGGQALTATSPPATTPSPSPSGHPTGFTATADSGTATPDTGTTTETGTTGTSTPAAGTTATSATSTTDTTTDTGTGIGTGIGTGTGTGFAPGSRPMQPHPAAHHPASPTASGHFPASSSGGHLPTPGAGAAMSSATGGPSPSSSATGGPSPSSSAATGPSPSGAVGAHASSPIPQAPSSTNGHHGASSHTPDDRTVADLAAALGVDGATAALAGEYLVEELAATPAGFVTSAAARALVERFHQALGPDKAKEFQADLHQLALPYRVQLAQAWLEAFEQAPELPEALALLLCDVPRYDSGATLTATIEGLLGTHPRISERKLEVRLDEILPRTKAFRDERVPAYRAYQKRRNELVQVEKDRLRLEEYKPKVMSAFVRNRLLDEVYLPLIGDNLAKQLGAAGEGKRTDQMGLLLLISPPGYGKTTLMEYVASRLGLLFVKVNGPALGHDVTSLDPAEAPNATARQEVEKISFALESGNNTLLYLDDIQHTSPELLQKFISLCDAQRRIEGVWNGRTRTYDLRGKRFAVCMAGNPYTESGQRFRIPDMLSNRADVWNLGDVLSGREELFALSYVDNALTSNPVLAPLSTRDRGDVELLVRLARGDSSVRADQLTHPYSKVELEQVLAVLRKLIRVQEVVLANNRAYIASAAQSDDARTEPPYKLQGSYRNMNKLAERIVPAMNDAELEAVISDHYLGEAQTLTTDAESNLLKLAELRGVLTAEQEARWRDVKQAFLRTRALGGAEDDPVTRAVGAIGLLADRVSEVGTAIRGS